MSKYIPSVSISFLRTDGSNLLTGQCSSVYVAEQSRTAYCRLGEDIRHVRYAILSCIDRFKSILLLQ